MKKAIILIGSGLLITIVGANLLLDQIIFNGNHTELFYVWISSPLKNLNSSTQENIYGLLTVFGPVLIVYSVVDLYKKRKKG